MNIKISINNTTHTAINQELIKKTARLVLNGEKNTLIINQTSIYQLLW